jgi:signal transduction histidine kinase
MREVVELSQIVVRAGEIFQAVAESRGITLQVDAAPGIRVEGHRDLLRQVVNNLVDNALKFTPEAGVVHVRLEQEIEGIRLVVEDTGSGIAPEDLPRIFERFFRGDRSRSRDAAVRGTGLGLSICRSVVESHGGRIDCQSREGAGARFTVTLPQASAWQASPPPLERTKSEYKVS